MIFLRYTGESKTGFTTGGVYLALRGEYRAVDGSGFRVFDEERSTHDIPVGRADFEVLSEVYAVWLGNGPRPSGVSSPGDVVCLTGADGDGELLYQIDGDAYSNAANYEIIDSTNLVPLMKVMDRRNNSWWRAVVDVDIVNGEISIDDGTPSGAKTMRSVTDFRFSVGSGIQFSPLVVYCHPAETTFKNGAFVDGKIYEIARFDLSDGIVGIRTDDGALRYVPSERLKNIAGGEKS